MQLICETNRLILQCLDKEAATAVRNFYRENRVYFEPYELTRTPSFYTVSTQASILDWEWKEQQAKHSLRYYMFLKEDPSQIIGCVNFSDIRFGCMQKAALGYKLDYRYWHHGYAYEACTKCLEIIFDDYGLHRIEATIHPQNQPSIRLIQKLGFSYEGLEREAAEVNHHWQDLYLFSKLNPAQHSS